jgi:hypothetical protein
LAAQNRFDASSGVTRNPTLCQRRILAVERTKAEAIKDSERTRKDAQAI